MLSELERLSLPALHSLKNQLGAGPHRDEVEALITRKAIGDRAPADTTRAPRGRPEMEEQRAIRGSMLDAGWTVYWLSQARKTGQTAGVPDLLGFHPIYGQAWVEVKADGGTQSPAQRQFQARCEAAGIPYLLGDRYQVAEQLARLAVAGSTQEVRHG